MGNSLTIHANGESRRGRQRIPVLGPGNISKRSSVVLEVQDNIGVDSYRFVNSHILDSEVGTGPYSAVGELDVVQSDVTLAPQTLGRHELDVEVPFVSNLSGVVQPITSLLFVLLPERCLVCENR